MTGDSSESPALREVSISDAPPCPPAVGNVKGQLRIWGTGLIGLLCAMLVGSVNSAVAQPICSAYMQQQHRGRVQACLDYGGVRSTCLGPVLRNDKAMWERSGCVMPDFFSSTKPKAKPRKKTVITRNSDEGPADTVNVDPNPDWADDTRKRILKGKGADTVEVNLNPERRAPYGSSACAEIKPKPNRGKIDWDWVVVRNTCSYPIQVLTCYYDVGRDADCKPSAGARGWGLSGTLAPGQSVDSVSTSKAWPWFVKTLVCDMRQGSDLWCVLPK